MPPEAFILLLMCIAIPLAVIAREAMRGQVFSLLSFYSLIFFIETGGGVIKAVFPSVSRAGGALEEGLVTQTLLVTFSGYMLFLFGYFIFARLSRRPSNEAVGLIWNRKYFSFLFAALMVVLAAGLYPIYQRVIAAGGIQEFLSKAYLYRFGTYAETDQQSALLAFANIFSGCSLGIVGLGIMIWLRGGLSAGEKLLLCMAVGLLIARQGASMLRSSVLFTFISIVAVYNSERPLRPLKIAGFAAVFISVLLAVNFVHQTLYTVTAGWEQQSFAETIGGLLAPHGHFQTLAATVERHQASGEMLNGEGLLECVFFFVPRVIWESKLPSSEFGTQLIQAWLELPTGYQMAVTNTGELIAHFGWLGMLGLIVYGAFYGYFDSFRFRSPALRVALYCMLLPRVLADAGMGISAFSNTIFGLVIFLVMNKAISILAGPVVSAERLITIPPINRNVVSV